MRPETFPAVSGRHVAPFWNVGQSGVGVIDNYYYEWSESWNNRGSMIRWI
jgi:hypothetical protein